MEWTSLVARLRKRRTTRPNHTKLARFRKTGERGCWTGRQPPIERNVVGHWGIRFWIEVFRRFAERGITIGGWARPAFAAIGVAPPDRTVERRPDVSR